MSWLGSSLNSITGHLSNFTKEVLIEGSEEVSDHAAELNIARSRVKELEIQCNAQRHELDRLRISNRELEERCQATDLQLASLTSQYRELRNAKRKEADETVSHLTAGGVSPTSTGDDDLVRRLQAQNEELSRQLQDAGEQHHQQMSALQDHHDERLSQLQNSYQGRLQTLEKQLRIFQQAENVEEGDDNQNLRHRLASLEAQLTANQQLREESNVQLKEKEKQIQLLNRQLEKLQSDKFQKSPKIQRRNEGGDEEPDNLLTKKEKPPPLLLNEFSTQTEIISQEIDDEKTRDEILILNNENKKLLERITNLEKNSSDVNEKSQEILTISNQNRELIEKIKYLETQILLKDEEILELSSEKEGLDNSLVELDGQHQEEINAVLSVKDDLTANNKRLTTLLDEANKSNEALRTEVQNLREEIENYTQVRENEANDERRDSANLEKELGDMKLRVKELESMVLEKDPPVGAQSNTAEFISGNTDANTMIQQISSENQNLQNEADDLRTKLRGNAREMDQLRSEIEAMKMENSKIREQLEERNAVVEGLEDTLEKSEKTHAKKIADNEEQVVVLKEKLDLLSKAEETRVKIIPVDSDTQTDVNNVVNTSNEFTTESSHTQTDSVSDCENVQETSRDTEFYQQQTLINDLRVKLEEMEADQSEMETLRLNEKKVLELQYVIQSLETQIKELKNNSEVLSKEVSQKDDTIRDLDKTRVEFERYRNEKSRELQKWMEKANENAKYVEELQTIRDSLQSKIDTLVEEKETESVVEKQEHHDESEKGLHDAKNVLRQKDAEIELLNSKIMAMESPHIGRDDNLELIKSLEGEKERLLTVLNEKSRECSSLKAEVHRLFGVVSAEKQAFSKLEQDNRGLSQHKSDESEKEMTKEAMQNLARIIKDKDLEIDALKQKNETLLAVMHQTSPGKDENVQLEKLMSEKDELSKQLQMYQSDREQIAKLLNQKHQESLMYHAEMQKLNVQLMAEKQNYLSLKEQHQSVSLMFEEKQKSLINTQNEVVSLKQRVTELERHQVDLSHKYSDLIDKNSETIQVNREEWTSKQKLLDDSQGKLKQYEELINEKDRMIYQLNHSLEETGLILSRKEETIKTIQHRLDEVTFKLSEAEMKLKETVEERASSSDDLERLRQENEALQEENKSLSMTLKQSQFEKDSMKEKMATLIQLVEEKEVKSDEVGGRSGSSAQLLQDYTVLEEKMGVTTQERDQALLALSQQQQENKNQHRDQKKLQEQNEKLHSELDRLRNHLLEIQDNYTQEIMSAEDREKTLRIKLASAEDRASLSSNAIANASTESQFRVDSLQQQLSQVLRQRDSALEQCSRLEDQIQQLKAAITNLQSALECIQGEHRRELIEASKASQEKLRQREKDIETLKARISEREVRLKETMEALDAASRLSEQLDRKEQLINELKSEVFEKQRQLQKSQDEIKQLESTTEGKVDKQIMKSLVLGYFSSPANQKPEVVRLLARILDFNQIEMEKAGVKIGRELNPASLASPGGGRSGWISSFIGKVVTSTPIQPRPSPAPGATSPVLSNPNQSSFSTLFVEFLKNESNPNIPARMPLESMSSSTPTNSVLMTSRKPLSNPSKATVKLDFFSPPKGSLTGPVLNSNDHPLMRPLSTALPTFTPIISSESAPSNKNATFLEEVLK